MKEWTGNKRSVFTCNGARNYATEERQEHDYYATEPKATEILLSVEKFSPHIWEPACGEGHMAKVLENHGYKLRVSDLYDRGYKGTEILDFLRVPEDFKNYMDIVTNPPYKYAQQFVEKALEISETGTKVAMFLKLTFLESKARKEMFRKYPPKVVYVSSSRLQCAKNGEFGKYSGTAVAYAWYVWEKGFKGVPIIRWVN